MIFCLATWGVGKILPTGFIPTEDQGTIYVNVTTPVGATLERTEKVMGEIDDVAKTIEAIESISTLAGFSMMTDGSGASFGMSTISLKPWKDRKQTANDIIAVLQEKPNTLKMRRSNSSLLRLFPVLVTPAVMN